MGFLNRVPTVTAPARMMAASSRHQPSMWIDANSGYMLPESAYKDVFAFAVVIAFMAWRPTGLIAEKASERV